jgi:ABC-2 type transport system permease protein
MTEAMTDLSRPPTGEESPTKGADRPVALARRVEVSAIWTLFRLTVSRQLRDRRLILVGVLFALPILLAGLARYFGESRDAHMDEQVLIFYMIPNALVPLTALLYAPGMIQDEVEEQTLTYLLVRPLPRWSIYVAKLLATLLVTSLVVGIFTVATEAVIFWGEPDFGGEAVPRAFEIAGLQALALLAYCSLFGALSLLVRRTLILGVVYILLFEGLFANIPFVLRKLTVMYYFRVLCARWLDLPTRAWSIDLDDAPSSQGCVLILTLASLVATALAATVFTVREFRVKTPEGG